MIPVNSLYKAKNYNIQSRRLLQWKTLYNFDTKEENYECCKDTTSPHIKVNQEGLFKRFFRKDTLKKHFLWRTNTFYNLCTSKINLLLINFQNFYMDNLVKGEKVYLFYICICSKTFKRFFKISYWVTSFFCCRITTATVKTSHNLLLEFGAFLCSAVKTFI